LISKQGINNRVDGATYIESMSRRLARFNAST
jgi:hypothetical protein